MDNFSKRKTACISAALLLFLLGWVFVIEELGTPCVPIAHCDAHFTCTVAARS